MTVGTSLALFFNLTLWLYALVCNLPQWLAKNATTRYPMSPERLRELRETVRQVLENPSVSLEVWLAEDAMGTTAVWKDDRLDTVCVLVARAEPDGFQPHKDSTVDPWEFLFAHEAAHLKRSDRETSYALMLISIAFWAFVWFQFGAGWGTFASLLCRFFAMTFWSRSVERAADRIAVGLTKDPVRRATAGIIWLETIRGMQLAAKHRGEPLSSLITADGDNLADFCHPSIGARLERLRRARSESLRSSLAFLRENTFAR